MNQKLNITKVIRSTFSQLFISCNVLYSQTNPKERQAYALNIVNDNKAISQVWKKYPISSKLTEVA